MTFEDDKGAYDQKDAEGFIRLNALRLRTLGHAGQEIVAAFFTARAHCWALAPRLRGEGKTVSPRCMVG